MNAKLSTKNYVHDELRPCGTPSKERHPRSFVGKESRKRSMRRSIDKQLRRWYTGFPALYGELDPEHVWQLHGNSKVSSRSTGAHPSAAYSRWREASPQHHLQHRNTKMDEGQETTVAWSVACNGALRFGPRPDRDACSLSRLAANRSGEWPVGRHVGFFRAAHTLGHLRNSRFSRFQQQVSAFWSNGLASAVTVLAFSFLLRFCYGFLLLLLSSSMQGRKYIVTDFLISTCEKSYASSKPTG